MLEVIVTVFIMLIVFIPILYRINKRIYEIEESVKVLRSQQKLSRHADCDF